MDGIITIKINTPLADSDYGNLDTEIQGLLIDLGLSAEIDDEQSGNLIVVK